MTTALFAVTIAPCLAFLGYDGLYFDKLISVTVGPVTGESVASLAGSVSCSLCFFGVLVTLQDLKAHLFRRAEETPPPSEIILSVEGL